MNRHNARLLIIVVMFTCTRGSDGSNSGDSRSFLDGYARMFDRARMKSGWMDYEFQEDKGPTNRIELLFRDQLFRNHTISISSSSTVESTEWYDGSRLVHLAGGTNPWTLIQPLSGELRNASFLFLGRVFGYWEDQAKILSTLESVGSEKQAGGAKHTFRDIKTRRLLIYETISTDGHFELPVKIDLASAQGKLMATWSYEHWMERGGDIWLPTYSRFEDFSDVLEGKPLAVHVAVYSVHDAIFNIPVSDAWFIPRIPARTRVEDQLCEPARVLLIDSFDPDRGFRQTLAGSKSASQSGSENGEAGNLIQREGNVEIRGGVGLAVASNSNGPFVIIDVAPASPSQKSGLQAGDMILAIDGRETKDMAAREFVSLVAGSPGTELTLLIKFKGSGETKPVSLTRIATAFPARLLKHDSGP